MIYNTILIDADNTLFDFNQAESFALEKCLEEMGIDFNLEVLKYYHDINSMLWKKLEEGLISQEELRVVRFEELLGKCCIDADPLRMSKSYLEYLSHASFEMEGAYEVCKWLSKESKIAIVTNGITKVQEMRLERSRLKPFITELIISEKVGAHKPSVDIFNYTFERLGVTNLKKVIMIGDSLGADIKGGINAGIDTCFFNPKGIEYDGIVPTYEIKHLKELLTLL